MGVADSKSPSLKGNRKRRRLPSGTMGNADWTKQEGGCALQLRRCTSRRRLQASLEGCHRDVLRCSLHWGQEQDFRSFSGLSYCSQRGLLFQYTSLIQEIVS